MGAPKNGDRSCPNPALSATPPEPGTPEYEKLWDAFRGLGLEKWVSSEQCNLKDLRPVKYVITESTAEVFICEASGGTPGITRYYVKVNRKRWKEVLLHQKAAEAGVAPPLTVHGTCEVVASKYRNRRIKDDSRDFRDVLVMEANCVDMVKWLDFYPYTPDIWDKCGTLCQTLGDAGLLHEDIAPRNVVIPVNFTGDSRPYFIDFEEHPSFAERAKSACLPRFIQATVGYLIKIVHRHCKRYKVDLSDKETEEVLSWCFPLGGYSDNGTHAIPPVAIQKFKNAVLSLHYLCKSSIASRLETIMKGYQNPIIACSDWDPARRSIYMEQRAHVRSQIQKTLAKTRGNKGYIPPDLISLHPYTLTWYLRQKTLQKKLLRENPGE